MPDEDENFEADFKNAKLDGAIQPLGDDDSETTPWLGDPEWSDYVISQLTEKEIDKDGHPKVLGLRRVGTKLLGTVLESSTRVLNYPEPGRPFAATEHTLIVRVENDPNGREFYEAKVVDAADVNPDNTDPLFGIHAVATCSSKTEGRAWRRLLMLNVIASEEKGNGIGGEIGSEDGFITSSQINFLNIWARKLNIDVWKYVNSGKSKYDRVEDIPVDAATKMNATLSEWKRAGEVPEKCQNLLGYKPDWRSK